MSFQEFPVIKNPHLAQLRTDSGNHIFDDLKTTVEESNMNTLGALEIYTYCMDTGDVRRNHTPIHVVDATPLIF